MRLSGPGEVRGMSEDMLKNAQPPPRAPAAVAAKPNEPRIGPNTELCELRLVLSLVALARVRVTRTAPVAQIQIRHAKSCRNRMRQHHLRK